MSDDFDVDDLSAELTGSVGVPDAVDDGEALPERTASAIEEFDQYQAEKDLRVSNDVEDSAAGDAEREAQRGKRTVPLAALQEERTKRQELQQQLAAHQEQLALLQQYQAQMQAYQQQLAAQQQQAEADAVPDFDSDPRAYIEHRERQFQQALGNLQNQQAQQQAAARFQQEVATVAPVVAQAENAFREANPDYDEACNFVQQNVEQSLRARYPGASESDMQTLRTVALVQFNGECLRRGINPAEHVYGRAQELGFTPGKRVPGVQSQGYQVAAQPRVSPNTSLSSLSGAARAPDEKGKLTAAQINDMDDAQFNELFEQMGRASHVGLRF